MLSDKFIEFLKEIGCNYYKGIIPKRIKGGTKELSISGDIPKDKLEEFLVDIYMEGYEARRDDEDRKKDR